MHAHTPPFTKPEAAYDSRRLYDETSAIAAAQDAKLDPIGPVESKVRTAMQYLYHAQLLLKEAFPYTSGKRVEEMPEPVHVNAPPKWSPQWLAGQGIPAESAYLLRQGSRIATPAEVDGLREVLTAEELRGFGIGDIEPRAVAKPATTVAISQHPANAETIRYHDERLSGPEDHL